MKHVLLMFMIATLTIGGIYIIASTMRDMSMATSRERHEGGNYILSDPIRPTHWDQSQWDTLDRYLKKIDTLEKRIEALENE